MDWRVGRSGGRICGPAPRGPSQWGCSATVSTPDSDSGNASSTLVTPTLDRGYDFAVLRGTFQYGDLHLGQTRGSRDFSLGSHSWLQRSHFHAQTWIFAMPFLGNLLVSPNKCIPPRY